MKRTRCTDRVVGAILASWRYDISGISPEMRRDYELHFAECSRCSARQKFHRSLDVTLAALTSTSALFFLFALAVLRHIKPLEHVAFNNLRTRCGRHVPHALFRRHRRTLLLDHCSCTGTHGNAGAILPGRARLRARQTNRRAPPGRHQVDCGRGKRQFLSPTKRRSHDRLRLFLS